MVTRVTGRSFEAGQKVFQGAVIHPGSFDRTVFE